MPVLTAPALKSGPAHPPLVICVPIQSAGQAPLSSSTVEQLTLNQRVAGSNPAKAQVCSHLIWKSPRAGVRIPIVVNRDLPGFVYGRIMHETTV